MRSLLIIYTIVCCTGLLKAQNMLGIGSLAAGVNDRDLPEEFWKRGNRRGKAYTVGAGFRIAPEWGMLGAKLEACFHTFYADQMQYKMLRAAISPEFNIGERVQFILGIGIYYTYMLAPGNNSSSPGFGTPPNQSQLGWLGYMGFGMRLNETLQFRFMPQVNINITDFEPPRRGNNPGCDDLILKLELAIRLEKQK